MKVKIKKIKSCKLKNKRHRNVYKSDSDSEIVIDYGRRLTRAKKKELDSVLNPSVKESAIHKSPSVEETIVKMKNILKNSIEVDFKVLSQNVFKN